LHVHFLSLTQGDISKMFGTDATFDSPPRSCHPHTGSPSTRYALRPIFTRYVPRPHHRNPFFHSIIFPRTPMKKFIRRLLLRIQCGQLRQQPSNFTSRNSGSRVRDPFLDSVGGCCLNWPHCISQEQSSDELLHWCSRENDGVEEWIAMVGSRYMIVVNMGRRAYRVEGFLCGDGQDRGGESKVASVPNILEMSPWVRLRKWTCKPQSGPYTKHILLLDHPTFISRLSTFSR